MATKHYTNHHDAITELMGSNNELRPLVQAMLDKLCDLKTDGMSDATASEIDTITGLCGLALRLIKESGEIIDAAELIRPTIPAESITPSFATTQH